MRFGQEPSPNIVIKQFLVQSNQSCNSYIQLGAIV